jgi:hypothetical protein
MKRTSLRGDGTEEPTLSWLYILVAGAPPSAIQADVGPGRALRRRQSIHAPTLRHRSEWKGRSPKIAEKVLEVVAAFSYAHTFAEWHHADGKG